MLNEDYSTNNNSDIPLWIKHENIDFNTSAEMLEWVSNDKVNFILSDMVYDAMMYCLTEGHERLIVATIWVKNETTVDVVISKQNFQKILSAYTERLLKAEKYERLSEIKKDVEKYNLELY